MDKAKVVLIGEGNNADRFISENRNNEYIDIIGRIPDGALSKCDNSIENYIQLLNKCDIGFALGYSKIIPHDICDRYFLINLHAGILPKWRGFSANAWALMNGENEIGYSLHRVSDELDGGLLYFVKRISLAGDRTMSRVHEMMVDSIVLDCPKVLYEIAGGINKGEKQDKTNVVYCTRFHPEMGNLNNFNMPAAYYVNLFRCMAQPLGSGVYFRYKDESYQIGCIFHGKDFGVADYVCEDGKIVNIEDNSLWVKVKDNVIVLSNISKNGARIECKKIFSNGKRIGG